ncbi:unnamed protein product, partial [Discosporangium mesarthrocarpum]
IGHGVVYKDAPPRDISTMTTFGAEAFSNVERGDYRVPDRRGVSANHASIPPGERSKPFLHTTVYGDTFRDFVEEVERLERVPEDEYENAFKRQAAEKEWVDIRKMPELITSVLGRQVQHWVLDRMLKVFEQNRDGRVRWMDLKEGLRRMMESNRRDVTVRDKNLPEWLLANRKVMPAVSHGKAVMSCYQVDLGKHGSIPANRRILFKTGMSSTTQDLSEGTTKDTFQIPGYSGFIPASKINARAREHGDMHRCRQQSLNLRLFHNHNASGYTGHMPTAARNDVGPMKCGSNPLSTSGAAALGLIL